MIPFIISLSINFDNQPKTYQRIGQTLEKFTLLDKDILTLESRNTDLFFSVQPHTIMGSLSAEVKMKDETTKSFELFANDSYFFSDYQTVSIRYNYRGGSTITVWQIPKGMCSENTISSVNQRSININIPEHLFQNEKTDQNLCWLFSFQKDVNSTYRFQSNSSDSQLFLVDNQTTKKILASDSLIYNNQKLSKINAIILIPHELINLDLNLSADISYADWTDYLHLFKNFNTISQQKNLEENYNIAQKYLTVNRKVNNLIWLGLFAFVFSLFSLTIVIFFVRPINKIHRSMSQSDGLGSILAGEKVKSKCN